MSDALLHSEYLDTELLSHLPGLEIRARFLVEGFLAGLHKSPHKGSSVEFKEYRDYQQGDELKLIDWKAYARTDRLHVKLREEETNMRVTLLVDKSASMEFKGPNAHMSKWDYSRALAAALLLFLHRQKDAASLGFIGSHFHGASKHSANTATFHNMMVRLHQNADDPSSDIAGSLEHFLPLAKRRSVVVVLSDVYVHPRDLKKTLELLRCMKCEVLLFHVLDPLELDFDFDEPLILEGMETDAQMMISPDLIRKEYREALKVHLDELSKLCVSLDCEHLLLDTREPPLHALGKYLSKRRRAS